MTHVDPYPTQKQKHPKGLYLIFLVEIWERFGYYLLTFILVTYMTQRLNKTDEAAMDLYANFIALVYISPFLGGVLADKFIGYRRSVAIGAGLLAIGYLGIAFRADQRTHVDTIMYLSLFLIIIGNGMFKPNIGTLLGNLYPQGDPRRDAAFGIFYMGVNIGALISPFVGGYLDKRSWSWAFASAGVGLLFGLGLFAKLSHKYLKTADRPSSVSAVLQVPLPPQYQDPPEERSIERRRILAILIMCIIVIVFWMAFHQNGTTLNFWAQRNTDLTLGGLLKEPTNHEYFQSANSLFVIILSPIIVSIYMAISRKGIQVSTPTKMFLGMLFSAAAFAIIAQGAVVAEGVPNHKVSAWWLIGCYFVLTIGELHLSPLGTSLVTKLAPRRMTAMMLGFWYAATSLGNKLVGTTGKKYWNVWSHQKFFGFLALCCLGAGVILFLFLPFLKKVLPKEKKM